MERKEKAKNIRILAIETSCDETAAAVVENGRRVLSNVVASQMEMHRAFGGVVPEVASRQHVEQITRVMEVALEEAEMAAPELDAVAVTYGPGLVGALLVGIAAGKALAWSLQLPLLGVNHMAGHIYANQLVAPMQFPLLALVVSGGHTELVYMEEHGQYEVLGQTRDDAVGEAYDKVGRLLGLPYPGGPVLDQLAFRGEATLQLPRAWLEEGTYDFSFSGLKTAVMQVKERAERQGEPLLLENLAASFQAAVMDVLVGKTLLAADAFPVKQVLLAGGVAANRGLRQVLKQALNERGIPFLVPPLAYCTDNAAMIGAAAYVSYQRREFAPWDLNAVPGLTL